MTQLSLLEPASSVAGAPQLRALTGYALWFYAMAMGWKDLENRTKPLPRALVGQRFCLHAGKQYDPDGRAAAYIERITGRRVSPDAVATSAIIAVVTFGESIDRSDSPWFLGPWAYPVTSLVRIAPVPCGGALGFWRVPTDVAAVVAERLETVR